jgi:GntR family transcriptional repressor for pyruvate dehydrogenase complex
MVTHMAEAPRYVKRMTGKLRGRLILDSEIRKKLRTRSVAPVVDAEEDTEDCRRGCGVKRGVKLSTRKA